MTERAGREGLDENDLAEAEAESDVLDADLEEYGGGTRRTAEEYSGPPLDESQLAEADAES